MSNFSTASAFVCLNSEKNSTRALNRFGLVLCVGLIAAPLPRVSAAAENKAAAANPAGGVQVAGELVVSLDARDPSAGSATWTNLGTMGNFTRVGNPKLATAGGQPAVQFNGTSDAYRSASNVPPAISGDHARSIEVWAYNPALDSTEECMVAWGHRGEALNNMAFSWGSGGGFSAATHYDEDMSWGDKSPAAGQWHYLVYTYDGKAARIYDNGSERGSQEFKLATSAGNRMNIAVENNRAGEPLFESEWDPNWPLAFSGSIGMVRVHSGALTTDQVKANFSANRARFGIGVR